MLRTGHTAVREHLWDLCELVSHGRGTVTERGEGRDEHPHCTPESAGAVALVWRQGSPDLWGEDIEMGPWREGRILRDFF